MAKLEILEPMATTNYIKNPSVENNTDGWTAVGSAIAQSLEEAQYGNYSLKVTTNNAATLEGVFYRVNAFAVGNIETNITASIYVRGFGKVRLRLHNGKPVSGNEWVSKTVTLLDDRWTRLEASGLSSGSDDIRLYVETVDNAQAAVFYVDGAQIEPNPYATTYCDGDQKDCLWSGAYHASQSTRDATNVFGGKWVTLADPDDRKSDPDLYATVLTGLGMPATDLLYETYAIADGAYVQGRAIRPRSFTISMHVHSTSRASALRPVSLGSLHRARQKMIDLIRPDRGTTEKKSPVLFRYTSDGVPLIFQGYYTNGLEEAWDIRNKWTDNFAVNFLGDDPYFYAEDRFDSSLLGINDVIGFEWFVTKRNGQWSDMGYSPGYFTPSAAVTGYVKVNPADGILYGFANDKIYRYFNNEWETLGTITLDLGGFSYVQGMTFAQNGDLYVWGWFSEIDSVSAVRAAYYSFSGASWNAIGTFNSNINWMTFDGNGDLYVGGGFTSPSNRIVRWDGSSFHALGAYSGLNGAVTGIVFSLDGKTGYVCGQFTDEAGNPGSSDIQYTAQFSTDDYLFTGLGGSAFSGKVISGGIYLSPTGELYIPVTQDYIYKYSGSTWSALGTEYFYATQYLGSKSTASNLLFTSQGDIIATGIFSLVGSLNAVNVALWNGSVWTAVDNDYDGVFSGTLLLSGSTIDNKNGDILYLAYYPFSLGTDTLKIGKLTTITNVGDRKTYPTIYIKNSGLVRWIQNVTTGATLYLNYQLAENEELIIDANTQSVFSTFRGFDYSGLLRNSDFEEFFLLPGDNVISVFITDDVDVEAKIGWRPRFWALDGVTHGSRY